MSALNLQGRLGVEAINPIRGCCIESLSKWVPRMSGEKTECLYCANIFKTVCAVDTVGKDFTGMLNECKNEPEKRTEAAESLWFTEKKFPSPEAVKDWCAERGIGLKSLARDEFAFVGKCSDVLGGTEKVLWAAPGVFAVIGVEKVDTGDLMSGGMLSPAQGVQTEEETTTPEVTEKDYSYTSFEKTLDALVK